jgi:hypothetical protein
MGKTNQLSKDRVVKNAKWIEDFVDQPLKKPVKVKMINRDQIEKAKPKVEEVTTESEVSYIESTRTDPLLPDKQQLVTLIYNNYQAVNEYIGTMDKFYRTGRLLG